MKKYTVEIEFYSGQIHKMEADQINFHPRNGGIDIFIDEDDVPVFPQPGEEETRYVKVILNKSFHK